MRSGGPLPGRQPAKARVATRPRLRDGVSPTADTAAGTNRLPVGIRRRPAIGHRRAHRLPLESLDALPRPCPDLTVAVGHGTAAKSICANDFPV